MAPPEARTGVADPDGTHLVVLARDPEGYASLSRVIAEAHLAGGEKGKPVITLDALSDRHRGHWQVLTGCRKGALATALTTEGPAAAAHTLDHLIGRFGRDHVAVELWDHGNPVDATRNDTLALLAIERGVPPVATNNVHYATPARFPLSTALAAVRSRRTLAELEGWLPPSATACLRGEAEQRRRFARWPGVVDQAAELAAACSFDLRLVAPRLPDFPVPAGHTEQTWLVELVRRGATDRYGPREAARVPGAWAQLDRELAVIGSLGFPGYFLTVWDIVAFCRREDIFCQGRGSAATSAVCYALGITNVDAVSLGLLFERFLSPARDGPPDIDVDIESGRREEVIQYVYERYGRLHAAQVANVITYRSRSALRDVGKALGHAPEEVDAWSKSVDRGETLHEREDLPPLVKDLAGELLDFPRHLGIHSGGMVICDRPVVEVCPVEWGRMPGRSVLQWDKDDCAAAGLVKFDLLGLGMLTALHHMVDLVREFHGVTIDLARLDQDPAVYDLLCRADTVGVFQVESRAQMNTLPRVQPRCFYDLAIEVALIRPGPIQGNAVHPYIRRRNGTEPITYLHPLLRPALERTLGVPLFQEQLMQIAIDVAGFTPTEADELRQAMSAKRSGERMARLRGRLFTGMAARQVSAEVSELVYTALAAFANFGFPESHSVAFAHLVYATAWCKVHYPAAFTAGLLNAQPMGFWSPQSLVADAKRHGVVVRRPDVNAGGADAGLEKVGGGGRGTVRTGCPAGRVLGTRYRQRDCGADRRGAPLVEHGGPGPPGRRLPRPAGGVGHGRRPRRPGEGGGSRPAVPGVGGGSGLPGHRGPAPRGRHRLGSPTPAPAHPVGRGGRRPVVARDGPRHHGHGVGSRGTGQTGGAGRGGAAVEAGRRPDHRRRGGHPPPAARERSRRRLLEPRGRDRDGQHRLLPGGLDPVEAGGPVVPGAAGTGTDRAFGGVDDPRGRAVRAARARPGAGVERFSLRPGLTTLSIVINTDSDASRVPQLLRLFRYCTRPLTVGASSARPDSCNPHHRRTPRDGRLPGAARDVGVIGTTGGCGP